MKKLKMYGRTIAVTIMMIAVVAIVIIFYSPLLLVGEPLETYHSQWYLIEDVAVEDAADFATSIALATDEGVFASKTTEAYQIPTSGGSATREVTSHGGAWMFAFCGTTTNEDTFSFNLVGWSKANGMAQIICEGDGVLGTQDVITEPDGSAIANGLWADTITLDETTKWPSVAVYNSGDNQVAILVVDLTGLEWIDFVTYGVDGANSAGEADTLGVYGRRY